MMAYDLKSMLEREEGRVHEAYPDPLTKADPWTIGIGHTGPEVHKGLVWTDAQIDAAYQRDAWTAIAVCSTLPWFSTLDASHDFSYLNPRQCVLVGMVFQMGGPRVMRFYKALAAMRDEHWATAAAEMLDSSWAKQTPARARRMALQIETGMWQ